MQVGPELTNKEKQLVEAVLKIEQGRKLYTEGRFELKQLTKTSTGGNDVTKEVEKLLPEKAKKVIANKMGRRKKRKPRLSSRALLGKRIVAANTTKLTGSIIKFVSKNEFPTLQSMIKKLKTSFYPVKRTVEVLLKRDQLRYIVKRNPVTNASQKYLALT